MPSTYLLPADTERLLALIDFFERRGTPLKIKTAELAAELEMPMQAVSRYVKWAERYGIILVTRTSDGFATGRSPNTYELLIGLDRWITEGPTIVAGMRARPEPPPPAPKSLPSASTAKRDPLAAEVRAEAAAVTAAVLEGQPPIPDVPVPPPLTDDEVGYWLAQD